MGAVNRRALLAGGLALAAGTAGAAWLLRPREAGCGPRLTRADLDAGIALAGRYLVAAQRPEGDFLYEVDWKTGAVATDNNAVRQAGATWGVALLHRETRDPAHREALDRALALWDENAVETDGVRWCGYPGDKAGRIGTVALVALSLLERLAAPEGLADPSATRAKLDALCAFVARARRPAGGFFGTFDPRTGEHKGAADPYGDGEALLLHVRSGIELGVEERVARALGWAEQDYGRHVAEPLAEEPDPAATKGYFQWSAMSWHALATAGRDPARWGGRLVEQAVWMVDVHATLSRRKNTAYAYEGIVPAWAWARDVGDDVLARKLACVVHQGLRKLSSWQLGHPLALPGLKDAPERWHGGVQNAADEVPLRIDVTQHQLHALLLARGHGADAAELPG